MKEIDLLVTTYNRLPYTKLFLDGIESQNPAGHYRYIFADAGSIDGTQEYLKERYAKTDSIFVFNNDKKHPRALHHNWQAARPYLKAPYFCMCDDDV